MPPDGTRAELALGVGSCLDRLPADAHDHVAGLHAGARRGAALLDVHDHRAARVLEAQPARDVRRDVAAA